MPLATLPGTVSVTYLTGILDFAVACGAPRAALLAALGLGEADVTDPDRRLPLECARTLFSVASRTLHNPAFALHFGVGVPCTTLTLAAALAAARPTATESATGPGRTLRDALDGLNRYAALGVDFGALAPAQRYRFVESDEGVWLEDCRPDRADGCEWPALTESVFARFATGIRRRGGEHVVRALAVSHHEPSNAAHRDAYDAVFRVPVAFAAARNAICLDPRFLERPLEPLPSPVETVLTRHADTQLRALRRPSTWSQRVIDVLHRQPTAGIEHVGRELAVSRQTLHRRLREDGTTFAALRDTLRCELADRLLRSQRLPVGAVAAQLGFSEPAAFSRAYKRWTGVRPSAIISE